MTLLSQIYSREKQFVTTHFFPEFLQPTISMGTPFRILSTPNRLFAFSHPRNILLYVKEIQNPCMLENKNSHIPLRCYIYGIILPDVPVYSCCQWKQAERFSCLILPVILMCLRSTKLVRQNAFACRQLSLYISNGGSTRMDNRIRGKPSRTDALALSARGGVPKVVLIVSVGDCKPASKY